MLYKALASRTVSALRSSLLVLAVRWSGFRVQPAPLYARRVSQATPASPGRSPTPALLFGLVITVLAVVFYSAYLTRQIAGLRQLQTEMVDRGRKDSLQLLRIQNDLNSLGVAMRDMLDNAEPYPLTAWSAQFERIHNDLDDALKIEAQLAQVTRRPEQQQYLQNSLAQFWDAADRIFATARDGHPDQAKEQVRLSLQARQEAISAAVARLLVENNEGERDVTTRISDIYDHVQRQVYLLLGATLVAISLTTLYLIRSNRQLFAQIAALSQQRSELAQKVISTQESTLRHLSRELHDEFGQVLTAIGSMLARVRKHLPEGSPVREDVREVADIAQSTLNKVRTLSQALHPVILDEAGLESALDWYLPPMERQTGIKVCYEKSGTPFMIPSSAGIHVYRVVQEALNNVVRHSGAKSVIVRLRYEPDSLELLVEDHGTGLTRETGGPGIGMVAMRERAEILGGRIAVTSPNGGGTQVQLSVPRENLDARGK
jgi:signal transduction histidine kinase